LLTGSLAAMSDVIRFRIECARPPGLILMGRPAATRAARGGGAGQHDRPRAVARPPRVIGTAVAPHGFLERYCFSRSTSVVRQRFFGMFWPLFLAGSERLRDNRRMTDAAHNQHSETRRPIATLQAFRAFRPIAGSSSPVQMLERFESGSMTACPVPRSSLAFWMAR